MRIKELKAPIYNNLTSRGGSYIRGNCKLPDRSVSKRGKTCKWTAQFLQPAFHKLFQKQVCFIRNYEIIINNESSHVNKK